MTPERCALEECDRPAQCRTDLGRVCLMHYKRWKRHKSFAPTRAWSPPNPTKRVCAAGLCTAPEDGASGLCKRHLTRQYRHGTPDGFVALADRKLPKGPDHYAWTGAEASYHAVHQRIRAIRGPASLVRCLDCGAQGAHWSYDRTDPDQQSSELGPYSVDLEKYVSRCVPCHKRFDLEAINALASEGP